MDSALEREIRGLLQAGRRISAVRRYRQETGADLKEATEAIDTLGVVRSTPLHDGAVSKAREDPAGAEEGSAESTPPQDTAWAAEEGWETQEDVIWATRMRRSFFIFSENFDFPPGDLLLQSQYGSEVRTNSSVLAEHKIDKSEVQKIVPKAFYFWQPSSDFMKRKQALDSSRTPWDFLREPCVCPSLLTGPEIDELEFTASQSGDENAAQFIPGWIEQKTEHLSREQWDAISNAMVALGQEPFDPVLWMKND